MWLKTRLDLSSRELIDRYPRDSELDVHRAKLILADVGREHGQAAVDGLIRELGRGKHGVRTLQDGEATAESAPTARSVPSGACRVRPRARGCARRTPARAGHVFPRQGQSPAFLDRDTLRFPRRGASLYSRQ